MQSKMAHANIQTRNGTKITIKGSPKEISLIIRAMQENSSSVNEETININRKKQSIKKLASSINKKNKSSPTATDLILNLKEEGFFNKAKGLIDIKGALETQGHIYPMSTLSGVVLPLVRKRELRRMKENKRWAYVKS